MLEKEVLTAVSDFERMDFEGILAGIEAVNSIMHRIPQDVKDCESLTDDFAKLERWASIFAHPITLAEHLIQNLYLHYGDVVADVTTARGAW